MKRLTTTGGKCFEVRTALRAGSWHAFIDWIKSEANPPRRVRRVRKIQGIFSSEESAIQSAIAYANANEHAIELGCPVCQGALDQIEITGSSDEVVRHETVESEDGLVYPYECKNPDCGAQWIYEVQTEIPDRKLWVLTGQSHMD